MNSSSQQPTGRLKLIIHQRRSAQSAATLIKNSSARRIWRRSRKVADSRTDFRSQLKRRSVSVCVCVCVCECVCISPPPPPRPFSSASLFYFSPRRQQKQPKAVKKSLSR